MRVPPNGNGHTLDDVALELDALVAEELAAVNSPVVEGPIAAEPIPEEPIERTLTRVARRLLERPDRVALLERLRREVLGAEPDASPAASGEPLPPIEPPSAAPAPERE